MGQKKQENELSSIPRGSSFLGSAVVGVAGALCPFWPSLLLRELERLSVLSGERFTVIVSRVRTLLRSVRRSVALLVECDLECECELECDSWSRVAVEATRGREELGTRS